MSAKDHQKAIDERDALISELTVALDKAATKIEGTLKDPLLKSLAPRMDMTWEDLSTKSLAELRIMKNTVDMTTQPTFKSGTAVSGGKKTSQRALLDSQFERSHAARLERSKKILEG